MSDQRKDSGLFTGSDPRFFGFQVVRRVAGANNRRYCRFPALSATVADTPLNCFPVHCPLPVHSARLAASCQQRIGANLSWSVSLAIYLGRAVPFSDQRAAVLAAPPLSLLKRDAGPLTVFGFSQADIRQTGPRSGETPPTRLRSCGDWTGPLLHSTWAFFMAPGGAQMRRLPQAAGPYRHAGSCSAARTQILGFVSWGQHPGVVACAMPTCVRARDHSPARPSGMSTSSNGCLPRAPMPRLLEPARLRRAFHR